MAAMTCYNLTLLIQISYPYLVGEMMMSEVFFQARSQGGGGGRGGGPTPPPPRGGGGFLPPKNNSPSLGLSFWIVGFFWMWCFVPRLCRGGGGVGGFGRPPPPHKLVVRF